MALCWLKIHRKGCECGGYSAHASDYVEGHSPRRDDMEHSKDVTCVMPPPMLLEDRLVDFMDWLTNRGVNMHWADPNQRIFVNERLRLVEEYVNE